MESRKKTRHDWSLCKQRTIEPRHPTFQPHVAVTIKLKQARAITSRSLAIDYCASCNARRCWLRPARCRCCSWHPSKGLSRCHFTLGFFHIEPGSSTAAYTFAGTVKDDHHHRPSHAWSRMPGPSHLNALARSFSRTWPRGLALPVCPDYCTATCSNVVTLALSALARHLLTCSRNVSKGAQSERRQSSKGRGKTKRRGSRCENSRLCQFPTSCVISYSSPTLQGQVKSQHLLLSHNPHVAARHVYRFSPSCGQTINILASPLNITRKKFSTRSRLKVQHIK